ncbi:MAG: cation diffusion facilitator family transporter [Bacteroidaceae bacterium]|nr:cation diffusion facilitator family transporter [Bacteroidaceae bacterium]
MYRVTLMGSVVNIVLLTGKFIAGILGNSAAMIADAVHSLSDFLTDIVVLVFVRLSNKPADCDHDYGHGKYETIATSVIGIALAVVGVMLGWNGTEKIISFFAGEPQQAPEVIALVAALVSIASKEWVYRVTRRVADETNSQALAANAWHHRSDALSSVGTALGIGGAILLGGQWAVLDAVAAVIVSVMIIQTAARLLRQASGELLEESLPKETEDRITEVVCRDKAVRDVHNLHTRKIGSNIAIEMHLRLPGELTLTEAHRHASTIEQALRKEFGTATHIMLHMEPIK